MSRNRPTMSDIAKQAGVSQSTVSIVLNGKKEASIPAATISRILEAAKSMNYSVKPRSQCAAPPPSDTVLVLAGSMTNPYYAFILQALERAFVPSKLHVLACNTYHRPENETAFLKNAVKHGYIAAIYLYPPDNPTAAREANLRIPVIAICDKDLDSTIDLIELDNFQAGCIAAEHLISLGHQNIAVLTGDSRRNLARANRIKGITHQVTQSGFAAAFSVFEQKSTDEDGILGNNNDYQVGYSILQNSLLISGKYTAFVAINDMLALGAMDALSAQGFRIPEDFSIIGFDNLLYTGLSRISLTTVDNHTSLLAQAAVDLLLHRMNPAVSAPLLSSARYKVECTPYLVARSSTAALAPVLPL